MPERPVPTPGSEPALDPVDEASWQSFPASDPPAWAIGQSYDEPAPASPEALRSPAATDTPNDSNRSPSGEGVSTET